MITENLLTIVLLDAVVNWGVVFVLLGICISLFKENIHCYQLYTKFDQDILFVFLLVTALAVQQIFEGITSVLVYHHYIDTFHGLLPQDEDHNFIKLHYYGLPVRLFMLGVSMWMAQMRFFGSGRKSRRSLFKKNGKSK